MDLPGRGGGQTSLVAKYCKFIVNSVDRRKWEGVHRCLLVACINCTCACPPCSLLQPMFWMFVAYIQGGRGGTNKYLPPPPNCVSRLGVPHILKMVSPGPPGLRGFYATAHMISLILLFISITYLGLLRQTKCPQTLAYYDI